MKKCLMLETPEKKRFFTHEENYIKLLEYANSFNCEISTVKLQQGEILDLISLADAICCQTSAKNPKFECIEIKKTRKRNQKSNHRSNNKKRS